MAASSNLDTLADLALDDAKDLDNTANRTTMRRYIADAAIELSEEHNWEHLKDSWTFLTQAGETDYRLEGLQWAYSMHRADGTPIRRLDKEDVDSLYLDQTGDVTVFANWGWSDGIILKLWPGPTQAETLTVNGITLQPRISATSDVPVVESRMQDLLILGGVWRWKRFQQNDRQGADADYAIWIGRVNQKKKRDPGARGPLRARVDDHLRRLRLQRFTGTS